MPVFGEYETEAEPFEINEQALFVSRVYRARRNGADGPCQFAVKTFRGGWDSQHSDAGGDLAPDLELRFLKAVGLLKQVYAGPRSGIARIYEAGRHPEAGAWYVTDYCECGSLRRLFNHPFRVDDATLRNVVAHVVAGCLTLRCASGRSHGNLKLGNMLVGGRPGPLRNAPLFLTDPYPASPSQLDQLSGMDRQAVDDLMTEVCESQDLHDLGELILQLVEGRIYRDRYEYNYPIQHSGEWNRLGKNAGNWLALCNLLLDPHRKPGAITLDELARRYPQASAMRRLPLVASAASILFAAGGVVVWWSVPKDTPDEQVQATVRQQAVAPQNGPTDSSIDIRADRTVDEDQNEVTVAQQAFLSWSNRLAIAEMQLGAGEYEAVRGALSALKDGQGKVTLTPDLNERLGQLGRVLAAEEAQLAQLRKWMAEGQYRQAVVATWPSNKVFMDLQTAAERNRSGRWLDALSAATNAMQIEDFTAAEAAASEAERWELPAESGRRQSLLRGIAAGRKAAADRAQAATVRQDLLRWSNQLVKAETSLKTGEYGAVRGELSELRNEQGTITLTPDLSERIQRLSDALASEETSLKTLSNWLAQGEYRQAVDVTNQWPRNPTFEQLLTTAERSRSDLYAKALMVGTDALRAGKLEEARAEARQAERWQLPGESQRTQGLLDEIDRQGQAQADRAVRLATRQEAYQRGERAFQAGNYTEATAALVGHRTDSTLDGLPFDELQKEAEAEAQLLREVSEGAADPFEVMGRTLPEKAPFEKVVAGARQEALRRLEGWLEADEFERVLGALKGRSYVEEAEFARVLELPQAWERMRGEQAAGRTNEVRIALNGLSAADQQRKPFQELAAWAKEEPREVVDGGAVSSTGGTVGTARGLTVDEELLRLETLLGVRRDPIVIGGGQYSPIQGAPNRKMRDLMDGKIQELRVRDDLNEQQRDRLNVIQRTLRIRTT